MVGALSRAQLFLLFWGEVLMDTSLVMDIAVESLKVTALVGAPVLGLSLIHL